MSTKQLRDGIRYEDETEVTIFNHYSFCELIKYIMVNYAELSYEEAHQKVIDSFLVGVPESDNAVMLLSHELELHWAMLLAYGDMYWTKGIPSDYNDFKEEYLAWESAIKLKHKLKDSFDYFDLETEHLIDACGYGLLERAKKSIDKGANINDSINGYTPLIASVVGQNIELVAFLIQSGAEVNQAKHTALHEAFDCIIENMIQDKLTTPDPDELKIIELLIDNDGDLEKRDSYGKTPLEALKKHSSDKKSFEEMKGLFRAIIPDIDNMI